MSKKANTILLVSALLAGVIADYFFAYHAYGLSVPVFLLFMYLIFFLVLGHRVQIKNKIAWFFTGSTLLISLNYFLYENVSLGAINHLILPFLFIVSLLLFVGDGVSGWYRSSVVQEVFKTAFQSVIGFLRPFRYLSEISFGNKWDKVLNVLKAFLFSAPIVLVVVFLLAQADAHFFDIVSGIIEWVYDVELTPYIPDALFIVFISVAAASLFYFLGTKKPAEAVEGDSLRKNESTVAITLMLLLNLVYALFIVLQFTYLFGGESGSFLESYTYAEYARKGFFELIAVAIINMAIILGISHMKPHSKKRVNEWQSGLLGAMVLFTFILLYSAYIRLGIYQEAYGLTYDRVYVYCMISFLAIVFALSFASLFTKKILLQREVILVGIAAYSIVNLLPLGSYIAQKNVQHFQETGKLDLWHMKQLRSDAIPYLEPLLSSEYAERIEAFNQDAANNISSDRYKGLPAFNVSRFRASRFLKTSK